MKRLLNICIFALFSIMMQAQIAELWIGMPDSLCPYLSQQQRYYLIQYAKQGTIDTVSNNMQGRTYIDTLDVQHDYLRVQMTQKMTWELRTDSSTYSIRTTVCTPKCASITRYYSPLWEYMGMLHEPIVLEESEEEIEQHF
ncbi:MAG: DUF3256 family protein [Paludibacteraceae bacterium]|nr:DUF3256 family protein [Paludibacteraceae bacterium]